MKPVRIVWFKRDLRITDHAPLAAAVATGELVMGLYIKEPLIWHAPDAGNLHWGFVSQSLQELSQRLKALGIPLIVIEGEAISVWSFLRDTIPIHSIFAHQETGLSASYRRDVQIAKWCSAHQIPFIEFPTNAVIRGRSTPHNWQQQWFSTMMQPLQQVVATEKEAWLLPEALQPFVTVDALPHSAAIQTGGEQFAHRYLQSFVQERIYQYARNISKPGPARYSCSRLSPYLAWGNISIRQIYQAVSTVTDKRNLSFFRSRLIWHCHFIQKFERNVHMDQQDVHPLYSQLGHTENAVLLKAWKEGHTGIPLVDACMRCVMSTGYLNFRMRSMLVSFLTHHLWQPWQSGTHHLAQYFLDYEPGIHYPQFQMQSAAMGIHTIRIYNPYKQAIDHDPEGMFIRKWVPEIATLPTPLLFQPHLLTPLDQSLYNVVINKDYPAPIVPLAQAAERARNKLWGWRKSPAVRALTAEVLAKQGLKPNTVDAENEAD